MDFHHTSLIPVSRLWSCISGIGRCVIGRGRSSALWAFFRQSSTSIRRGDCAGWKTKIYQIFKWLPNLRLWTKWTVIGVIRWQISPSFLGYIFCLPMTISCHALSENVAEGEKQTCCILSMARRGVVASFVLCGCFFSWRVESQFSWRWFVFCWKHDSVREMTKVIIPVFLQVAFIPRNERSWTD